MRERGGLLSRASVCRGLPRPDPYLEGDLGDIPCHDDPKFSSRHGRPPPLVQTLWRRMGERPSGEAGADGGCGGGGRCARRHGADHTGSCESGASERARDRPGDTVHDRTSPRWPVAWKPLHSPAPFWVIRPASFAISLWSRNCDLVIEASQKMVTLRSLAIVVMMASCCQGFGISSPTLPVLRSKGLSSASVRSSSLSALSIGKS
jgi:hypothetical protein